MSSAIHVENPETELPSRTNDAMAVLREAWARAVDHEIARDEARALTDAERVRLTAAFADIAEKLGIAEPMEQIREVLEARATRIQAMEEERSSEGGGQPRA